MKPGSGPATSLLLAGGLCLLPFLLPYHQQPVLSFFPEWLAVALGAAAALLALPWRGARVVSVPLPARWLIAFAFFLAVQAAAGAHAYYQLPLLAALYVLYAALMIWLGAQLAAAFSVERVATLLATFLLAGALANSFAGVIQYYGRPELLEGVIAERRTHGAFGNIAQWSLYANYLALGQGALVFLWLRERVRSAYALAGLILLVVGSALSGSRGALLYALWYAAFGMLALRIHDSPQTRRLQFAAYTVAGATLAAHFGVPWLNDALQLGSPGESTAGRLIMYFGESARREIAWLALRIFSAAPVIGVGMGEFAGAAFEMGLDPSLTRGGQIWTSPHNLPLHLLAETGVVGTVLALGGLCAWGWRATRAYRADPGPALWWILAAVGVELIHSLIEFPLWSADFLGVTALLVGASANPESPAAASRASRIGAGTACLVLSLVLAIMLRDYMRLDVTRITGTRTTLSTTSQAQRDAAVMRDLTRGPLGPLAELWIVTGSSLDRNDLADKLAMSGRVARFWPSNAVAVRRAVFLALDGDGEKSRDLLARALRTFPDQLDGTIATLEEARDTAPGAIEPLIEMARAPSASGREPSSTR